MQTLHIDYPRQHESETNAIEMVIEPSPRDLGGFFVNRCLPVKNKRSVGPWVFFDEMGPAMFERGEGINVRPHPHINLATVTYLFEGEMLHRDSLGTSQIIKPGAINLMVAGKGIVHSERPSPTGLEGSYPFHGLQLWMALPAKFEEMDPAFYHYPASAIPEVDVDDVCVRVMIGEAYGVSSPVKQYYRTLYLEAKLNAGQQLYLPDEEERGIYIVRGSIIINDQVYQEKQMVVLSSTDKVILTAAEYSAIALIGGQKIEKRFMEWNFISTREDRIKQAKMDWLEGRFPIVPGDESEFIPLPGAN